MTKWDKFFDEKIKLIAKGKVILDAGGGKPFQKHMAPYKELFSNSRYISLDKNGSPDDGIVVGDIHQLPFADEFFDAVICKSALEHVENPQMAVNEIRRVLKKGGQALFYVPFIFPYHAEKGFYKDYWRFTEDGLRYLLKDFSKIEIQQVRGFFETLAVFIPYFRKILIPIGRVMDKFFPSKNQTAGFNAFAVK